jgi:hypothetical protein
MVECALFSTRATITILYLHGTDAAILKVLKDTGALPVAFASTAQEFTGYVSACSADDLKRAKRRLEKGRWVYKEFSARRAGGDVIELEIRLSPFE